jgi:hypothetical protein
METNGYRCYRQNHNSHRYECIFKSSEMKNLYTANTDEAGNKIVKYPILEKYSQKCHCNSKHCAEYLTDSNWFEDRFAKFFHQIEYFVKANKYKEDWYCDSSIFHKDKCLNKIVSGKEIDTNYDSNTNQTKN